MNSQRNKKSPFVNKFSQYIQNKIQSKKQQELFGQQFKKGNNIQHHHNQSSIFPFSFFQQQNNSSHRQSLNTNIDEDSSSTIRLFSNNESNSNQNTPSICPENSHSKRKKLKKLKQIEENVCAICLDQINKKCQLQCKHKFCFDCLQQWFKNSNKCPFCRTEVLSYWFKGQEYIVEPKEFMEEEQSIAEGDESMDYVCYNCQNTQLGDTVLICQRCEVNACHIECDQSLRGRYPRGQWYCHFCR